MITQPLNLKRLAFVSVALFFILATCWLSNTSAHSYQDPKAPAGEQKTTEAQQDPPNKTPDKASEDKDSLPIIKAGTNLVTLNVTVTDSYGRYVTGLNKEHFEIYDDKVPQKIDFFADDDTPVSMGILFDISGSMKGRISRSHDALRRFCDTGHDLDEYFLVTFNNGARLTHDFTLDSSKITGSLALVEPKGQTALYDAAYIGVEKVRQGRYSRKAILLISDGQDNNSRYTLKELKQLLKEADVQLYAIGITNIFAPRDLDIEGQVILEELTRLTGGRAFFPNNEAELNEVITRIGLELRHQYSIGYEPTNNKIDTRWHKIQVKLKPPKGMPSLTLRTREGYFMQKTESN